MKRIWILALTAGIIVLSGCGSGDDKTSNASTGTSTTTAGGADASGGAQTLTGAGSTFVNPAMSKWTYAYHQAHSDISINYQSVGSGAGIGQLKAGTVDFAASDVALSDKESSEMPGPVVQMPIVSGCEVVAYNLPGVGNGLKLSGDVIADIFLGKITKWDDPRIVGQNAGMKLPSMPINVVHRSDGSGTTYIFTDYLCAVSPEWKAGPGKGKTVNWPVGVGGKGNEGVAGNIKSSTGSIGYVELAYAVQTKLTYGPIKNKAGQYVDAGIDSTAVASNAAADALKADIRTSIVDTADPKGYPIAGFTYVMVPKESKDKAKAQALLDFLKWAMGPGQEMAKELQYAPLPQSVTEINEKSLAEVQTK